MNNIEEFHEKLISVLPEEIIDFCIMNDKSYSAIQINGIIKKENDKYYFLSCDEIEMKQELLVQDKEQEKDFIKMIKKPQNMYAGITKQNEIYNIHIIHNTGAEDEGESDLWDKFRYEYLKFKEIKTYKEFLRCLKLCIKEHNKTYDDNINICEIFPDRHNLDYLDE